MAEGEYSTTDYKGAAFDGGQDAVVTDTPALNMPAPEVGVEKRAGDEERAAADESANVEERAAATAKNETSKTDSTEKLFRKKHSGALVFVLVTLAFLAVAAGSYFLIYGSPFRVPEASIEKEYPASPKDPGISNPEKKPVDKDGAKDTKGDGPGDDSAEDPKEDPAKDPNDNGENGNEESGNKGNGNRDTGGTSQVWHPAWDEWVVSGHYETRYIEHPAVYGEVIHPAQGYYAAVCNTCGAIFGPGLPPDAAGWHLMNSEKCESYKNNVWIETSPAWVETIVIAAAWTETVQVWIDTSHWVRHEGYWV